MKAPFSDSDTSLAAAIAIEPHLGHGEELVLDVIRRMGAHGACDHEIEAYTGLIHQTASARRRGLVIRGLIEDSGLRRKTPGGRAAKAWRLADLKAVMQQELGV